MIENSQNTILIVDDNLNNLQLLFAHLRHADFKVLVAESGRAALKQAEQALPDLILLDVMMPDIDGFQVCRQLKQNNPTSDIPVIFMTAMVEPVDKLTGFNAGGVDYITKPFQIAEVLARINAHLTIRQLQRRLEQSNRQLEQRVQDRTSDLAQANQNLQIEIDHRMRHQAEKDKLFEVVEQQNQQLRGLTNLLLRAQQNNLNSAQLLFGQLDENLRLAAGHLEKIQSLLTEVNPQNPDTQKLKHETSALTALLAQTQTMLASITENVHQSNSEKDQTILGLSNREREVLKLLIDGLSPGEVANRLCISTKTVYTYRRRLMTKLGVENLTDLIRYTLEHRLLTSS